MALPLRLASCFRPFERAGKLNFRELAPTPKGDLVGVVRKSILLYSAGQSDFQTVLRIKNGGRPKGIVNTPSGRMYVGEYGLNPDRRAMRIWGSDSGGANWELVYTLKPGSVRHIHNIVWDPYRKGLWVLTGDREGECALLFTRDEFKTLDEVVRGGQIYRACDLICRPDGVYYGTDSETAENWFVRLEPETGKICKIQSLPGSVLYMNRMADYYFISTAVEPSKVNKYRYATLWQSRDLENWTKLIEFEKDFWPGEYFGFGRIVLPRIEGECPYIVFTPMAVKKYHMTTFIYRPEQPGL